MIGKLNHVAIATADLEAASRLYRDVIGLGERVSAPQALPDHGVTTVFVDVGNTKLELLEPLGEDSPIRKFVDSKPDGGIHHLCFEVDDLAAAVRRLEAEGCQRQRSIFDIIELGRSRKIELFHFKTLHLSWRTRPSTLQ